MIRNRTALKFPDRQTSLLLMTMALGIGWLLVMLARSPGALLDDEITHYLISLNAWRYWEALLDVWGRPGNTFAYMFPAMIGGLEGRRLFAIALTALTALLTTQIGVRLGIQRRWWIAVCFFFQSWVMYTSYTSITQVPFSLYLTLGVWCWITGRFGWTGFCFGMLAIVRHEGVALTAVWALYALLRRQWWSVIAAAFPLVSYNALYLLSFGRLASGNLVDLVPTTEYGSGSWFHFVPLFAAGVGVPILLLFLIGILPTTQLRRREALAHRPIVYLIPYALYFMLHTVIYRFGLFASGGYAVFLLPLAPGVALIAARGGEWLWWLIRGAPIYDLQPPAWIYRLGALVVLIVVLIYGMLTPPIPLDPLYAAQRDAAAWVREHGISPADVYAAHIVFWQYYEPHWRTSSQPWWFDAPNLPNGSILVWDSKYSESRGIMWKDLINPDGGWRELARFGDIEAGTAAVIFERVR
ncbi:hypothetical protein FBR02_15035 [Anaerolineae bacterium CFX9]|nr:hypothetical protein [Anaerolineae bacterium CFX9]